MHCGLPNQNFGWAKSAAYDRRYTSHLSEILRLAVLTQYRRVTDTHTHTQTHGDGIYRTGIALRGKNGESTEVDNVTDEGRAE